ncbi:unnamed protein product [Alopecurus aequalis]
MDDGRTDVLVGILERLHPNARHRLRLVCRHWRHIVDTRTATSLSSRITVERAHVFDADLSTSQPTWEMPRWPGRYKVRNDVVGTCNGIVCICTDFGGILLFNPVTGDKLPVPSLPPQHSSGARIWHHYSFTHDQATGRYMVVYAPYYSNGFMVFTLGEAAWRCVVWPYHINLHGGGDGFVTIKSMMYCTDVSKEKVRSFDLDGRQAPSVIALPSPRPSGTWRLTEVLGMLGIVFSSISAPMDKMEVWVMERGTMGEAKHARWRRWYSVQIQRTPRNQPQWHDQQHLTWPHFAHGSNHFLTWKWLPTGGSALYRHRVVSNDNTKGRNATVVINERNQGTLVAHIGTKYDTFWRFDYFQTREPLSVYKCW